MRIRRPIASTDYVSDTYFADRRLDPKGMRRGRLDKGIVRLANQHFDAPGSAEVYGIVRAVDTQGSLYYADIDIPEVASTSSYREDVDSKLRGMSFSVGARVYAVREETAHVNGRKRQTIIDWELMDVVDTHVPADVNAVQRSMEADGETFYFVLRTLDAAGPDGDGGNMDPEDIKPQDGDATRSGGGQPGGVATADPAPGAQPGPATPSISDVLRELEKEREERQKTNALVESVTRELQQEREAREKKDNEDAIRNMARKAGIPTEQVDRDLAEGNVTRGAYAEHLLNMQFNPQPLPSVKRNGLRGLSVTNYIFGNNPATRRAWERQAAREIEIGECLEEMVQRSALSGANPEGQFVPFAFLDLMRAVKDPGMQEVVSRAINTADVSESIQTLVDVANSAGYLVDRVPWLEMIQMPQTEENYQVFFGDDTDKPTADGAAEGGAITEASPSITGEVLQPRTIASYWRMPEENLVTQNAGLEQYFMDAFASFIREKYAGALLAGGIDGLSGMKQFDGVWERTGVHNTNYGAAATNFDRDDIIEAETKLYDAKASGDGLAWIASTGLEKLARQTAYGANSNFFVAMNDKILEIPYYRTTVLSVSSVVNPGILGYWSRCVSPQWGGGFDIVIFRPASPAETQFSLRMFTNLAVVEAKNFSRIKQT